MAIYQLGPFKGSYGLLSKGFGAPLKGFGVIHGRFTTTPFGCFCKLELCLVAGLVMRALLCRV